MDSKDIGQLLEKYWNCETTLEEESRLRDYFNGEHLPEGMKETAELFKFFASEKKRSAGEGLVATIIKQVRQGERKGRIVSMLSLAQIGRIAAGLLVVAAAIFLVRQEIKKSYPSEVADTYSDPQLALEETKKALMLISRSFGKAKEGAGKISLFNEAEKKIQGKTKEEEKSKISI